MVSAAVKVKGGDPGLDRILSTSHRVSGRDETWRTELQYVSDDSEVGPRQRKKGGTSPSHRPNVIKEIPQGKGLRTALGKNRPHRQISRQTQSARSTGLRSDGHWRSLFRRFSRCPIVTAAVSFSRLEGTISTSWACDACQAPRA